MAEFHRYLEQSNNYSGVGLVKGVVEAGSFALSSAMLYYAMPAILNGEFYVFAEKNFPVSVVDLSSNSSRAFVCGLAGYALARLSLRINE